jgi:iron complex transport system ATP-binding protein
MAAAFSTDRLSVGYHGKPLVSDIVLDLPEGTVLTLIGPNGSGKSTILKTIAKYLATITGTVYLDQRSIAAMSGRELARKIAVVLTDRLKTELMTCADVVATGRYPHTGRFGLLTNDDRRAIRQAMELLRAWELRDLDFRQLSDGQKQRILIARALCQEPQVIVLDEPTAYLDIRYKLELLTTLRGLAKQRGITVIMSLHELDIAQKISDLILCVDGNTITSYGPPAEIFAGTRINRIFGLDHGSYDPLFGSLEFAPPSGPAEVFVIAGGGTGIPAYRALQQRGIPFITGILHDFDIDYRIGSKLASEVFASTGFNPPSQALFQQALTRLKSCHTVVNPLTQYGALNSHNRDLAKAAAELGLPIVTNADDSHLAG